MAELLKRSLPVAGQVFPRSGRTLVQFLEGYGFRMTQEMRDQLAQLPLEEVDAEDAVRNFRIHENAAKSVSQVLGIPTINSELNL